MVFWDTSTTDVAVLSARQKTVHVIRLHARPVSFVQARPLLMGHTAPTSTGAVSVTLVTRSARRPFGSKPQSVEKLFWPKTSVN